jgi:signal transduction histidine kinase
VTGAARPTGVSLRGFLVASVALLAVVPPLVGVGVWELVAHRQHADAAHRVAAATAYLQANASRLERTGAQGRLRTRLGRLHLQGLVYEFGGFGKRPVYVDRALVDSGVELEPVADTADGTLFAALVPDPPDRTTRLALALLGGFAALALGAAAVLWLTGRWLVQPLRHLSDGVDRIAGGEPLLDPPPTRVREVANVAYGLSGMAAALREAGEQEARRERERRFLISAIAHDLRTPLFALRGYLQAVELGIADAETAIPRAQAKAAELERLIGDLFSFTRLEFLDEQPPLLPLCLGDLLRQATEAFEPLAQERLVSLHAEGADDVEVLADGYLLERVAANLLDNAVRHSPDGGAVDVEWGRDGGDAWFAVADRGDGIPDAALPHLFEPLYRAPPAREGEARGAGLGLTIARRLVGANGGTLTARNRPGGGAVFTATLPALRSLAAPRT